MISFELHLEKWHEKTQKPLWFLGFPNRYLFRFAMLVAGVGFEPHDLRVMSPTSYQAALPRDIKNRYARIKHLNKRYSFIAAAKQNDNTMIDSIWCRKPGSNRYGRNLPRDFKSRASANSATPANPPIQMGTRRTCCRSVLLNSTVRYR